MRKKKSWQKIIWVMIFVILLFGVNRLIAHTKNDDPTGIKESTLIGNQIEQQQLEKSANAQKYIDSVVSEPEIIALQEIGSYSITHSKEDDFWPEWLVSSELTIIGQYRAVFSIPSSHIYIFINDNGNVNIFINKGSIEVFVELYDSTASYSKTLFGQSYSPNETTALSNVARKDILKKVSNEENSSLAIENVAEYLTDMATKFGVTVESLVVF